MAISDDTKVTQLIARSPDGLFELQRLRANLHHAVGQGQWFLVCCMCSVIGELIYAALDPKRKADMFPKLADLRVPEKMAHARHQRRGVRRNLVYHPVAALRHTCFHPAMAEPIRDLPRDLFPNMSSLHTADVADWALEQLDLALRFELDI